MASASRSSKELLRLQKELKDIEKENVDEIDAHMKDTNIFEWVGFIKGPSGTPYEGGHFILDITIPNDYPYNPPKIKFNTKIWHPNISSQTGAICLDVLKNEWSPALTIRTALLSIQALLSDPQPVYGRKLLEPIKKITEMGFSEDQAKKALIKANWNETLALNTLLENS
ncbi:hypothetical protein PFHG_04765 [Plasmodium falciparum HB3]|uniref:Uncharacterized protein n=1 Tax=Plasmodium falciparum (isolate HB3) TaxID=137071 RepID=A0A0L7KIR8_PLAFX|nr:hypothetical protein PFHG_04765 [Plasmodium falciparum HB3]